MAVIHNWWGSIPSERFWLEVTDRSNIGANLHAPQANEHGDEFWSYSLLKEVSPGDTVYHYDKNVSAIVARSRVTSRAIPSRILWAARGASARNAGIREHERPGWRCGLADTTRLRDPVSLTVIRSSFKDIKATVRELEARVGKPVYFPFELGTKRPPRPMQGYLFKLPVFFLRMFDLESSQDTKHDSPSLKDAALGVMYRPADEELAQEERDPFEVDPAIVERGLRSHARTQNLLARHVASIGLAPLSPQPDEPSFDLAWRDGPRVFVAEVKSITQANEEKQLRLALGQVLRYADQLGTKGEVVPVVVVERAPKDTTWIALCGRLGVLLAWPAAFSARICAESAGKRRE